MTSLFLSPFSFLSRARRQADLTPAATAWTDDVERRDVVGDMIAAGACESEYGVQMLMSVFPDRF